ncbi:MAG: hypothetical protein WCI00_00440 [bacterium]
MTWSVHVLARFPHSQQVIVTFGVNEIKFCGHTIHVTKSVAQLCGAIFPSEPGRLVYEVNHVSQAKVRFPYQHAKLPVLIYVIVNLTVSPETACIMMLGQDPYGELSRLGLVILFAERSIAI